MTFTQVIEETLKHYQDPAWLGESSPLASTYFLGNRLTSPSAMPVARGRTLQSLLQETAASLEGKNAERFQTILREYYFKNRPAAVVWDLVGLAKNSFHLSRNAAIAALEEQLTERLQPALRLEQPPLGTKLLERKRESVVALDALDKLQSVAILGVSGSGKSAFAAWLAQKMSRPTFWYTIRSGLNDQLESLLFALGLFAHQQGSSTLWLALHTTPQQIASEQMLGIVRYTLSQMQPLPLLCLDHLEQLQAEQNKQHVALISLLESLSGLVPMLWIGERISLPSDEYLTLGGLSPAASAELLSQSGIQISASQQAEIYELTKGNPRLLKLALASFASGETSSALPNDPALESILSRTMGRLSPIERNLLKALSVYRTPAPMHWWQTRQDGTILNSLLEKQLMQSDGLGGVEIPLVYRQQIYRQLTASDRQQFHHQAAEVRVQAGAYTAAAYHLLEAGEIEAALALWRTHQQREVAQGQAAAAYAIFQPLITDGQSAPNREQAMLICAQIDTLHGQSERVIQQLSTRTISTSILAVEAGELLGIAANDHSEFAHADQVFQQSLKMAESLVEVRMARLHKGRAWSHLRQRELDLADRELSFAHYEIENMRGNLAFDRGHYGLAQEHYRVALTIAEELVYHDGIGKTSNNLAGVALWLGQFEDAICYLDAAFNAFQTIGKVADMAGSRITLAVAHNQAKKHAAALDSLDEAQSLFTQLGELTSWQSALLEQARAEAYLGLGQFKVVEKHVKNAISRAEISILPDAYRVYGEFLAHEDDRDNAELFLRKSLALAEENEDRYLAAYAWRSLARLYAQFGDETQANTARARAVELFSELHLSHEANKL